MTETEGYWSDITSSRKTEVLKMHIASAVYFSVELILLSGFFLLMYLQKPDTFVLLYF
jgi:hypothetical protein